MRVHLVDGTYELFRAHYSKRPSHESPTGKPMKATVGVVQSLLTLLEDRDEAVTHLAVAFDNPIESFRNELFKGYKTGEGMEPELTAQMDDVEKAVAALGVVVWSMKDFEADDALATAAFRLKKVPEVEQVRILTPDKDLGQCLEGTKVVQVDRMRQKLITEESHRAEKCLAPESVPDFLALVGDTADGIPGLDGWGEKGAAAVLSAYPHLELIPDQVHMWKAKPRGYEKLAAELFAHREEALLYRKLATLRTDAPLPQATLKELRWEGAPREQWLAWCNEVGANRNLAARPAKWRE
ncbi:MAG: 5'-3' exonuclease H3TH domain-containing protein [Myxococcaceae bacterium]